VERVVGISEPDSEVLPRAITEVASPPPGDCCQRPDKSDLVNQIFVEIVRGRPSPELDTAWDDLLICADTPNVFMQPRIIRAATPDRRIVTLLAWRQDGRHRQLAGFWAFSIAKPHLSLLPIMALCAPAATEHAYLSAPVIDRDYLDATLRAMLEAIAETSDLPKIVALESMSGSGTTYRALLRVLGERGSPSCRLEAKNRPLLLPGDGASDYMESALSSSSRKKLRQHRRRLSEMGRLETVVARSVADVQRGFEAFLTLEQNGWKGQNGSALLSKPDQANFGRTMITTLAQAGAASIYALELDGRPISVQVVLRAGHAAYTWKTAYDERLGDYSPGMLLFEDYSKAFLADPTIAFADSCAFDDTGYMAAWKERKLVIDLWFDTRRGQSISFTAITRAQKTYLPLREMAKKVYQRLPILQAARNAAKAASSSPVRNGKQASSKAAQAARAI
jgi:hypothetical protein